MITQTVKLSVIDKIPSEYIHMPQWDSGRTLICQIADMQIPEGATGIFRAQKRSGIIYNTAAIKENAVEVEITSQTLAEPGFLPCQIEIREGEKVIKTFKFSICVDAAIPETGEESGPESSYFDKLVERAETAAANAKKSETESENSASIATDAANSAAQSATEADRSAQSAGQDAQSAFQSAQSAAGSEESAEQSARSAADSKTQAAQSEQNAANSAKSAEDSQTQAKESAKNAQQSAQNAAESQTQAEGSAKSAQESAQSAADSQTQAEGSAKSAQESAQSATESAESAKSDADRAQAILDSIPEDYTEIQGKIEELQEEVGRKAPAIILTAEGEPTVIQGSADAPMQDMELTGKTEQQQTAGEQLFDISKAQNNSTIFLDGNKLILKKYACNTEITPGQFLEMTSKQPGDKITTKRKIKIVTGEANNVTGLITFISKISGISDYQIIKASDEQRTTTIPENFDSEHYNAMYIYGCNVADSEGNLECEYYDLMINSGETTLPWEPYTGSKPSPSPEYPQDIVNTQPPVKVEVMGKNIIDLSGIEEQTSAGINVEWDTRENILTLNGTSNKITNIYFKNNMVIDGLDSKKRYILSLYKVGGTIKNTDKSYLLFSIFTADNSKYMPSRLQIIKSNENNTAFHQASDGIDSSNGRFNFLVQMLNDTGIVFENYKIKVMLSIYDDEIPQKYIPYTKPKTVTIASDRHITQWDKLIKQDDIWGWLYKSNEVEFDGSEDEIWRNYPARNGMYIVIDRLKQGVRNEAYCNKLINDKKATAVFPAFWAGVNNNFLYILNVSEYASDANEWKTWLQDNPIKFLYETENTEFVPLSQEEQDQINALHTYGPTTVIITDPQMGTKVDYVADTKTYIDNKFAEIAMQLIETMNKR